MVLTVCRLTHINVAPPVSGYVYVYPQQLYYQVLKILLLFAGARWQAFSSAIVALIGMTSILMSMMLVRCPLEHIIQEPNGVWLQDTLFTLLAMTGLLSCTFAIVLAKDVDPRHFS